ncbi:hypothetical protein CRENPOLYSF2_2960003 [Crenothrix polyspora]|uniref:Uncharacterized protein n=1 Tax=Crenothrix polyspora TaxID=360316 RepID=A0A1R4H9D0_9GAMM|nr:hypothetical protein CRENPOLYSF2_2960003 [Crenothrix polyspora]
MVAPCVFAWNMDFNNAILGQFYKALVWSNDYRIYASYSDSQYITRQCHEQRAGADRCFSVQFFEVCRMASASYHKQ